MEAASLYAYAIAARQQVVCVAHVTNAMAVEGEDFEKGEDAGPIGSWPSPRPSPPISGTERAEYVWGSVVLITQVVAFDPFDSWIHRLLTLSSSYVD